jgi:hypothetical protein
MQPAMCRNARSLTRTRTCGTGARPAALRCRRCADERRFRTRNRRGQRARQRRCVPPCATLAHDAAAAPTTCAGCTRTQRAPAHTNALTPARTRATHSNAHAHARARARAHTHTHTQASRKAPTTGTPRLHARGTSRRKARASSRPQRWSAPHAASTCACPTHTRATRCARAPWRTRAAAHARAWRTRAAAHARAWRTRAAAHACAWRTRAATHARALHARTRRVSPAPRSRRDAGAPVRVA